MPNNRNTHRHITRALLCQTKYRVSFISPSVHHAQLVVGTGSNPLHYSPLMAQRLVEEIIRNEVYRLAELFNDVRSAGGDLCEGAGLGDRSRCCQLATGCRGERREETQKQEQHGATHFVYGLQEIIRQWDVSNCRRQEVPLHISDSPVWVLGCSREMLVWRRNLCWRISACSGYIPRSACSGSTVRPVRGGLVKRGLATQGAQTMREMGRASFPGKFGGRQLLYNCYRYTIAAFWFRSYSMTSMTCLQLSFPMNAQFRSRVSQDQSLIASQYPRKHPAHIMNAMALTAGTHRSTGTIHMAKVERISLYA